VTDEPKEERPKVTERSQESTVPGLRNGAAVALPQVPERELDELIDLHRLVVESVRDYAIFALDATGHILTWNPGVERIAGYQATEILGRHFSIFYPPEDIAAGRPKRELEIATREGRYEEEGWRVRKDGTRYWTHVVLTAMRDRNGELRGFAKVTRDLTERRRSQEILQQSEERFQRLVQSVKDYGIFMLDPEGYIASWNEGAQRINGYTAAEIVGRHFSVFYPAEDIARGKPEYELRVAAAEGRFEDEGWRIRKDGSRFWSNVIITALHDDNGELIGYAKVTRDLTERRRSEERAIADARRIAAEEAARFAAEQRFRDLSALHEQLRAQTEELDRQRAAAELANRSKSEFLAAMSHELRTPLNAIGGYAEIIAMGLRGPVTEEQRQDLERIRRSQQHLLGIINDILNFSRIEAGQVAYDIGPVQIRDVFDTVTQIIQPQAGTKGLHFEPGPCPSDAVARADRGKVEQILLNLLSNAVKFTKQGGRVVLTCSVAADSIVIEVQDTGRGIPADKLEAIFEPFVQVGRSLTQTGEGTGLGLAISRDLARAMGGDITVVSEPGVGSTFTVTLPRDLHSSG
jgi:PAS domain S-box-containing protein